jgi:multidrug efflux pump subunit AcrA (membrane-fusion protein)
MLIPARSVLGNKDNRFVYTYQNGKAKKQDIKVGISNFDQVEVLEGLQNDSIVIIPDDKNSLSDNVKVTKVDK